MAVRLLAHSAPKPGRPPQAYCDHVREVKIRAVANAMAMAVFARDRKVANNAVRAVEDAAELHDLGKLDAENQAALGASKRQSLPWDHIDAGVAYLLAKGAGTAAWTVRAHHAPGLPRFALHFSGAGRNRDQARGLRGCRHDDAPPERHLEQVQRTDGTLQDLLAMHASELGESLPISGKTMHGLPLRLALSCLVDADHTDTARFHDNLEPLPSPEPRWHERLAALDCYGAGLSANKGERNHDRAAFYAACRHRAPDAAMAACEGPVGIGKTTAVTAYLLRRAIATKARRLFIVAPYTAILSQTAKNLRKALLLPDEQAVADAVIAEHHHRADFQDVQSRDLAVLWRAPIILTTAVQFFETLASNEPAMLRKLHALPGSVVFIDEAHAALPASLWPQNWRWLRSLAADWGCSFAFASGSLARFWENEDIVGEDEARPLPDLVPSSLANRVNAAEAARVTYRTLGRLSGTDSIIEAVYAGRGPRLLIFNTVQNAAFIAKRMRDIGHDVLHISTALAPADRARVLQQIIDRLRDSADRDWTLVATSLVEAGVDISFGSAFRERFSASSLIQVGGRVNRHGELGGAAVVSDFFFDESDQLRRHPGAKTPAAVLSELLSQGFFEQPFEPAALVTEAMQREISRDSSGSIRNGLLLSEQGKDYPETARLGRVIDADTRLVVVEQTLRRRIEGREKVGARELLSGSVQIWVQRIGELRLEPVAGRQNIYWWPYRYDPSFLGYMAGMLELPLSGDCIII